MAGQELQTIKDRLDVVDLIGSYIQVKRSGTNYKAVCPFHNEKSASLMISPQKQIWHCFGCGEGGDIFGFMMRFENIEFKDALKLLADKAGIVLPEYSGASKQDDEERKLAVRINTFAAKFFHKLLHEPTGATAKKYLQDRGLSDETISEWQIGFSPDDYHALENELKKKGVAASDMIKAGVSVQSDRGIYDRFRGRVMFPIQDFFGNVVGFSARTLERDAKTAKYINSPETVAYHKGKVLFGFHQAKEAIRKSGEAVIVEGQMDCIQAHQAGFANTVATSGTALTFESLKKIRNLSDVVKFCFDADSAGVMATKRVGEIALSLGLKIKIIELPHGKDPDELIKTNPEAWKKSVANAVWFMDFYIKQGLSLYAFGSIEQKHYASTILKPLLQLIAEPVEREHYQSVISKDYGIGVAALQVNVKEAVSVEDVLAAKVTNAVPNQVLALEKQIAGGLIAVPEFAKSVQSELDPIDFLDPDIKGLVLAMSRASSVPDEFLELPLAKEVQFMVESQLAYLDNNTTALVYELQKSFYLHKLQGIKQRQQRLTQALKQAEQQGGTEEVLALGKEFSQLNALRMQYEAKL
jgi:DNA primase